MSLSERNLENQNLTSDIHFSFERIGNQIKSFFWKDEKSASVKKDLSDDLVDAREPRFEVHGYEAYEGGDYTDEASDKVAMEEDEEKEEEELGL